MTTRQIANSATFLVVLGACTVSSGVALSDDNDLRFLAVPKPAANAAPSKVQQLYGGRTILYRENANGKAVVTGAYNDKAALELYVKYGQAAFMKCAPFSPSETVAVGGPPGTSHLPGNYPSVGFDGSRFGGCAVWSTAICNRILGETDPNKPVDQVEWNELAKGVKMAPDSAPPPRRGGTNPLDIDAYYKSKGYCVSRKTYNGTDADRKELGDKVVSDHCDVKLEFFKVNPGPPRALSNGHVETVTGITAKGIQTNSWGTDGYVNGGTAGGFSHSNPKFAGLWPPNSTQVNVSYVCKCSLLDKLF